MSDWTPRVGDVLQGTYNEHRQLPVGTVVADVTGYWAGSRRKHVKTGDATWAVFFREFTLELAERAVRERRNNLSPCPTGPYRIVALPRQTEVTP